jgi:O-antigen ligase
MQESEKESISGGVVRDAGLEIETSKLSGAVVFCLYVVLAISTIAYGAVDLWALGCLSILTAVIACLWAGDAWKRREFLFSSSTIQLPLIALAVIGVIQLLPLGSPGVSVDQLGIPVSSALTLDPYATRIMAIHLVVYITFFAAALTYINHRDRLRKMVLFVVIFVALMAFFGILQRLASLDSIYGLRQSPQAMPFGSFVNQHHFAALMEMASGLALGLLFGKATKKANRPLLIIASVLMGIAIIFTGSRGGLISFVAILAFIVFTNLLTGRTMVQTPEGEEIGVNPRPKLMMIAGCGLLILFMFLAVLLLGGEQSVLRGLGAGGTQVDFTTGRSHFWSVAVQIFWSHPVLGAGLDAFGNAFSQFDTWNGTFRIQQAHNDYLQILADAGIAGFLCVAAFIYLLFKKTLQVIKESEDVFRKNTAIGALAGCAGILIHSFFDFPLRTPANAFFFLTLVALATVAIYYPPRHRKHKKH